MADDIIHVQIKEEVFPVLLSDDTINLQLVGEPGPKGEKGDPGDSDISNLELQFPWNIDFDTLYSEPTEFNIDENITKIEFWDTSAKVTKLYTKVIVYTAGNPTLITLTDNVSGKILTSTIAYDINGEWLSTDKVIS